MADFKAPDTYIAPAQPPERHRQDSPVAWRYRFGMSAWKYVSTEDECNQLPPYERQPLYAAAQEDALDAKRYRWLRYRMNTEETAYLRTGVKLDKAIDAALADAGTK